MDKQNIFRSCSFHANTGDVVHVLVKDLTDAGFTVSLNDGEGAEEDTYSLTTTVAPPILPLLDKSGNEYTTVIIGAQEWIVENFKSTIYADDTAIPNLTANGDWIADVTGAYCWYDNDSVTYKEPYGALYNWYAVNNAHGLACLERGGVLEAGWRIPTDIDWQTLVDFVGDNPTAGGILKETGITHWTTPNTGATDGYGFTAVPSGERNGATGAFSVIYNFVSYWTSDAVDANYSWADQMFYNSIIVQHETGYKKSGGSVRLVRDIV